MKTVSIYCLHDATKPPTRIQFSGPWWWMLFRLMGPLHKVYGDIKFAEDAGRHDVIVIAEGVGEVMGISFDDTPSSRDESMLMDPT